LKFAASVPEWPATVVVYVLIGDLIFSGESSGLRWSVVKNEKLQTSPQFCSHLYTFWLRRGKLGVEVTHPTALTEAV
jgi:hypothetical protein